MYEPLRRLLNVDEFSVLSPMNVDDCRELLAARLLTPGECAVRSGSMLDDGRPLFYGMVAAEGFQSAQYRGQWEGHARGRAGSGMGVTRFRAPRDTSEPRPPVRGWTSK